MMWSFSESRIFRNCQRQWFYKKHFANDNPKNTAGWEAYLLSKLQTVAAWRGAIVDNSIKIDIVPALNKGWKLNTSRILENAKKRFDTQLDFARRHRLREPGLVPSRVSDEFAAFYAIEYGQQLTDEEISQAWHDVETALRNLLSMEDLLATLRSSNYLVPQQIGRAS